MDKKTMVAAFILFLVVLAILYHEQISKQSIQEIAKHTSQYVCIFKDELCDCGPVNCTCGNYTVNKTVCGIR